MKVIKKILQTIGGALFAFIVGGLLTLLFAWIVPYVISYPKVTIIVAIIVGLPSLVGFIFGAFSLVLLIQLYLCRNNIISCIIQSLLMLYFGWISVRLPWVVPIKYPVSVNIAAVLLTLIIVGLFISIIWGIVYCYIDSKDEHDENDYDIDNLIDKHRY